MLRLLVVACWWLVVEVVGCWLSLPLLSYSKMPMDDAQKSPLVSKLDNGKIVFIFQQEIYTWNPKQPFINGCLVKQPFFM